MMDEQAGRRVGAYEVIGEVGRGGMGTVHLARQVNLRRNVALKELSALHAGDPAVASRFVREARLAGSLNHPAIVAVHEYLEHDGVPYIAMEYLARGSLRPWIGRLTTAQIGGVLIDALEGLAYAHEHGVVHRDLKPENLLVTDGGHVAIADFGIAKAIDCATSAHPVTATGTALGTPAYMAPEQALAQPAGPMTDVYGLGVIAYELLVGALPFPQGDTPMAVLFGHVNTPVPPPLERRPDLDPRLAAWLERLLAKRPEDRPPAAAAAEQLDDILVETAGPRWRRSARITGSLASRASRANAHAGTADAQLVGAPEPSRRRRSWHARVGIAVISGTVALAAAVLATSAADSPRAPAIVTPVDGAAGEPVTVTPGDSGSPAPVAAKVERPTDEQRPALDVAIGQEARGSVAVPGDRDVYTFHGERGQHVFLDAVAAGGRGCAEDAELYWELHAPNDDALFPEDYYSAPLSGSSGCEDQGPHKLPRTGRYTLTVYGDGDTTGRYAFRLWDAQPDTATMHIGDRARSAIQTPGNTDVYTFHGERGQHVFLDAVAAGGRGCAEDAELYWELHAPNDDALFPEDYYSAPLSGSSGCEDQGPHKLPRTGRYTLTVYGDGDTTGRYAFRLWDAQPDTATMHIGDRARSAIQTPGNTDVYTFHGERGQHVFLDAVAAGGRGCAEDAELYWELHAPNDDALFPEDYYSAPLSGSSGCEDQGPHKLPRTGRYTLTVYGDGDTTGRYAFRVVDAEPDLR